MYGAMDEMLRNKKRYEKYLKSKSTLFFILIFLVHKYKEMSFLAYLKNHRLSTKVFIKEDEGFELTQGSRESYKTPE